MRAGTARLVLGVLLAAALGEARAAAGCDDRPGTPNELKAVAQSPTSIRLSWMNTSGRASGSPHRMYFDIYVSDIDGRPAGLDVTGDGPYDVAYGCRSFREFGGLSPGKDYCFSMRARDEAGTQGCISRFASQRVCVGTTVPPGADPTGCKSGFVWRTATPADNVCVTPEVRTQTLADNRLAHTRRVSPPIFDPSRCPVGAPKSRRCYRHDVPCLSGYVWRAATDDDYVCVPPPTRDQAWGDNELAAERRVVVDAGVPPPAEAMCSANPAEVAVTCSGQAVSGARWIRRAYRTAFGCGYYKDFLANSDAEATTCAQAAFGDAFEESIREFPSVATTGPNGCAVRSITAADEDKAKQCATSFCGVGCESEIGECP
jgi:hypothetical protein